MIAEKTADAIRGRKLTPFEPPTRIATAARYPNSHVPQSAIYYKSQQALNGNNNNRNNIYQHREMRQQQQQYPPPLDQQEQFRFPAESMNGVGGGGGYMPAESQYGSSVMPFDRSITELANLTSGAASPVNADWDINLATGLQDRSSQSRPKQTTAQPTTTTTSELDMKNSHHEFMLKHYAGSTMVDNLIKRLGSIR